MKPALVVVLNPFLYDSRVLRQVEALVKRGHATSVFALHEKELPTDEARGGYRLQRFRLTTRPWPKNILVQLIKYLECVSRMTLAGARLKPGLVHANDLNALPIGYLVAKITQSKLIYDSHELWSDPTVSGLPKWLFKIATALETFLARRANTVITVSDSIAQLMAKEMKIPTPLVIRNLPKGRDQKSEEGEPLLHQSLGLTPNCPVILYIGGLTWGRGLEVLIDSMAFVSPPAVAVMMGPHQSPDYLKGLKDRVSQARMDKRVRFHAPVHSDEVARYAKDATIGVVPFEGYLNFQYGLPNKLFECLQAGLPVVVTDLPELSSLVRQYGVGETFADGDPEGLASTLNHMLSSPTALAQYRAAAFAAAQQLSWSNEEPKLLAIYDRLCDAEGQVRITSKDVQAREETFGSSSSKSLEDRG